MADERHAINLGWLIRLRWGAVAGQAGIILIARTLLDLNLPVVPLLVIVGLEAASNAAASILISRRPKAVSESVIGVLIAIDFGLLTALLFFSGGPFNPFSFLYLVYIALAAVVLRPRWTWGLVVLSVAMFGSLFFVHQGDPGHDHDAMLMHTRGMWLAMGVAAVFIVFFVHRVTGALAKREKELGRSRQLASLATLAAGAAHELATPLSTIALVAKELERRLENGGDAQAVEDAKLIRSQVAACRDILASMSTDAGESPGESIQDVGIDKLIARALEPLATNRIELDIDEAVRAQTKRLPLEALARALRGIVKNALEASEEPVSLQVRNGSDEMWRVEVRDRGEGMNEESLARATEPFYSTKGTGKGMGLGLFLARELLEQLGGELTIVSAQGEGTTVTIQL